MQSRNSTVLPLEEVTMTLSHPHLYTTRRVQCIILCLRCTRARTLLASSYINATNRRNNILLRKVILVNRTAG
jgi:hypothetical protein